MSPDSDGRDGTHRYQFGDSDLAAERLEAVARVFRDSTANFVRLVANRRFRNVIDLGCGPGFTTRLLAEMLGAGRTAGLDVSEHFLHLARQRRMPVIEYFQHDVRATPFPIGPADLLYCRFLLSHLPDLRSALNNWPTQLKYGGVLLVDEVEAVETCNPLFRKYLSIVEAMLRAFGSELYAGPAVEFACPKGRLRIVENGVRRMNVANRDAALMFSRNVPNWRRNDYVRTNFSDGEIDELLGELNRETDTSKDATEITWELRQMVFERI